MYGEVAKIIFIANDITEKKLMEFESKKQTEQLKIQEEQLKQSQIELSKKLEEAKNEIKQQFKEIETVKIRNEKTLEGTLDSIFTVNQGGTIEFFNKAAEQLWGLQKKEIIGENIKVLFSNNNNKNDEFVKSLLDSKKEKIVGQRKEINITNNSGEKIPVLVLLSEAKVNNEHTYTAFIQNIEVELF